MTLDQDKIEYEYVGFENAIVIVDDSIDKCSFYGDSECLVAKDLGKKNPLEFSSFLRISHLPRDIPQFMTDSEHRFLAVNKLYPLLRKLSVFIKTGNKKMYKEHLKHPLRELKNETIHEHFYRLEAQIGRKFRPFTENDALTAIDRITLAETTNSSECKNLISYFKSIGWTKTLAEECGHIRETWFKIYEILNPMYLEFYWDREKQSLNDYFMSQKRFSDLKAFFVDCYESLARISVIACGVEGIILRNGLLVDYHSKVISLEEFRGISNGIKSEIVKGYRINSLFSSLGENGLRNGIGHHSAHHDINTDLINFRKENSKGVSHNSIAYMEFCMKAVVLFCHFDLACIYARWLFLRASGSKMPVSVFFEPSLIDWPVEPYVMKSGRENPFLGTAS